jgi:ribosomal-protein-alanine N-acetyltransferase
VAKYPIETERCILRPPTLADIDAWVAKLFSDPAVIRYVPKRDMTPREDAMRAYNQSEKTWSNHSYGGWAVIDKSNEQVIGRCGLTYHENSGDVEIGYGLTSTYWGKGLATEVARAIVRYGFETAKLNEIVGVAATENIASWRVLERVGFVFVKKDRFMGLDVVFYKIAPDQFEHGAACYQVREVAE